MSNSPTQEQMREFERIRNFFWHKQALLFAEMNALLTAENELRDAIRKQWNVPSMDSIEFFLSNGRIEKHVPCFCEQNAGHLPVVHSISDHWI